MTSASLLGRRGDRHRETKKLGGGHTVSGRASQAQSSHWCTMQKSRETSTFLVFACLVNGYSFAHTQNAKVTCKDKKRFRVFGCVLVTFWLAILPFSFAPWPNRQKGGAFLHPALFCSEGFYYKCKRHVILTFLNLETDSFKVTLWILFIHIPWFYQNLFWQALQWRLVPHNHNPKGKKLGLLIQSQKYFIFQLIRKHQLYFPSIFF